MGRGSIVSILSLRRSLRTGVCLLGLGGCLLAAPPTQRPTRPAPVAPKERVVEYVDLMSVARRFGLKPQWLKPGERMVLSNDRARFEFEADSREIVARGMRVFLGEPVRAARDGLRVSRIDAESLIPALIRAGSVKVAAPAVKVIAIDPGHGGPDQGTENKRLGLQEKKMALDVAVRLAKVLEAKGYKVVLTRRDDRQLKPDKRADLQERTAIANRAGADLFVSVHFNSVPNDNRTRGIEVFAFTPAGQKSTDAWSRPNADDTEKAESPVNRFDHWNFALAHSVHRHLVRGLSSEDRGQKMAHFAVLRRLNCPGILVEAGFLSNDGEARKISTAEHRQRIAEAIALGVQEYAGLVGPAKP